jgi:DNA gyrase subunit A
MRPDERIASVAATKDFDGGHYLLFSTRKGQVKKTELSAYGNPRRDGIIAINLAEGDELMDVALTDGTRNIILGKSLGKAIRFKEENVRPMGRAARGVRGVTLDGVEDSVVSMVVLSSEDSNILAITENGFGKRSRLEDYRITGRGGKGIITIKASERNGALMTMREVQDRDELMITTRNGIVIRLPVKDISTMGRNTQGVKIINLGEGDKVADVARIVSEDEAVDAVPEIVEDAGEETPPSEGDSGA